MAVERYQEALNYFREVLKSSASTNEKDIKLQLYSKMGKALKKTNPVRPFIESSKPGSHFLKWIDITRRC